MILINNFYAFILYVSDSGLQCNKHNTGSYWYRVQFQDRQTALGSWYGPVEMILPLPLARAISFPLVRTTTLGQSVYPDIALHISNYYISMSPLIKRDFQYTCTPTIITTLFTGYEHIARVVGTFALCCPIVAILPNINTVYNAKGFCIKYCSGMVWYYIKIQIWKKWDVIHEQRITLSICQFTQSWESIFL